MYLNYILGGQGEDVYMCFLDFCPCDYEYTVTRNVVINVIGFPPLFGLQLVVRLLICFISDEYVTFY